jgi:hypothetical protein
MQGPCQSRLGTADRALARVVHVTTAASSLGRSYAWSPPGLSLLYFLRRASLFRYREHLIFVILYELCLLHEQFRYVTENTRYLESHVQLADRCAPWKFINLVLQALLTGKVGICRKFISLCNRKYTVLGEPCATRGPVCALEIYQPCFASSANWKGGYLPQIPRRGKHKTLLI